VDISQDSSKRKLISSLAKQFRLQIIQPCSDSRNGSCLNFVIHGSALRRRCLVLPQHTPDDHKALLWSVLVAFPSKKHTQRIPNKMVEDVMSLRVLKDERTECSLDVLKAFQDLRKKNKSRCWKLIKHNPKTFLFLSLLLREGENDDVKNESKLFGEDFWLNTELKRFSGLPGEAFSLDKRILIYNIYEKKDGQ